MSSVRFRHPAPRKSWTEGCQAGCRHRWFAQTASIISAASARTPAQVGQLLRHAFAILTAEPTLAKHGRSQLRQMETVWMRALPPDPAGPSQAPDSSPSIGL